MENSTDNFKKVIQEYLNDFVKKDQTFSNSLMKKEKNIDDCITYILNQVKQSKTVAFVDEEIFKMAVHYYDEDKIDIGTDVSNVKIFSNKIMELSDEDKALARKKAIDLAIQEEKNKLFQNKKPEKSKVIEVAAKKPDEPTIDKKGNFSLF